MIWDICSLLLPTKADWQNNFIPKPKWKPCINTFKDNACTTVFKLKHFIFVPTTPILPANVFAVNPAV